MNKHWRNSWIVVLVVLVIWFGPVPAGLTAAGWQLTVVFVAVVLGFLLQPLPPGVIALLGIAFAGLFKLAKPAELFAGFGNPVLWLIAAAFFFAKAMAKTGLGQRLAYTLIAAGGDSSLKLAYGLVFADCLLAPFIPSNTARSAMLYPVIRSLCAAFGSEPRETSRKLGAYLLKTAFQGNCITTAMFLTAAASNTLVAALAMQTSRIRINWETWALAGVLPGLLALAVMPYIVYKLYPPDITRTTAAKAWARQKLADMKPLSYDEKAAAVSFGAVCILWITAIYTRLDLAVAALAGAGILLAGRAVDWQDLLEEKTVWHTFVWLGAVLGLTGALAKQGVAAWLAKLIGAALVGCYWPGVLGVLLIGYLYAHYGFASLAAQVSTMYAALLVVALAAGTPPFLAAMSLGFVSALAGGLTHYATGAAPIFFGAGYVPLGVWWRLGLLLSVINVIIFIGLGSMWWKFLGLW